MKQILLKILLKTLMNSLSYLYSCQLLTSLFKIQLLFSEFTSKPQRVCSMIRCCRNNNTKTSKQMSNLSPKHKQKLKMISTLLNDT